MVRDGAVGQAVPTLQKARWVWAGVRRSGASFNGLETRCGSELDTLVTHLSGKFSRKSSKGSESGMEHLCTFSKQLANTSGVNGSSLMLKFIPFICLTPGCSPRSSVAGPRALSIGRST